MARAKKVLLWIVASGIAVVVLVLVAGLWWASSLYQSERANPERASAAFAEVRGRFAGMPPAFEIRDNRLVVVRTAGTSAAATTAAVYLLVWVPDQQTLSRVRVPFTVSLVATEPLPLDALAGVGDQGLGALMEARRRGDELNIRIADLERYGRTLLLDGVTPDGKHLLMWNE